MWSATVIVPVAPPVPLPTSALLPFYASSFTWNACLGMTYMLVPLYARSLGMSGIEIGSLIALPVMVQIVFNLLSGAWTDRLGGNRTIMIGFAFTVFAGLAFPFSTSMAALMVAQLMLAVSRSVYWPASWSIASQFPGDRARTMGRLNAITSAGQIMGTGLAGLLIEFLGFATGFFAMAGLGALAMGLAAMFRDAPMSTQRAGSMLSNYLALAKRRSIWFGVMCAYISAMPFTLSVSFYPILLVELGYDADSAGWMLGARAIGSIAAGVVVAGFVRSIADLRAAVIPGLVVAAAVGASGLSSEMLPVLAMLLTVGLAAGVMTVYFQLLVSSLSTTEQRGSALALAGLGWSLSHLSTPVLMGFLKDRIGIVQSFEVLGLAIALWTLLLIPAHRWAVKDGKPL
jgi:predicted MFS family arabinose efflux permease